MHRFETIHQVAHSAEHMFDLVADVERYPEFVPLCEQTRIRGCKALGPDRSMIIADMTVAYKMVRETFTSRALIDRGALVIDVAYIDGPFRQLDNRWTFKTLGQDLCEVHFFIAYEFRSRMLGSLMGAMFDRVFSKFSEAFEARADIVYGRQSSRV